MQSEASSNLALADDDGNILTRQIMARLNAKPPLFVHKQNLGEYAKVLDTDAVIPATTTADTVVRVAPLPSKAVLQPQSLVHTNGLGTGVQLDIGIAADPDALIDGVAVNNPGTVDLIAPGSAAGVPLWELMGLSEDPGGEIELIATIKNGSTTGSDRRLTFSLLWVEA